MVFNSFEFVVFLSVLLPIFYVACSQNVRRDLLLLVASYIFYMMWYWQYASLILLSTVVDFFIGRAMVAPNIRPARKKMLLLSSLGVNLGLLAYFKYYNFFAESSKAGLAFMGIDTPDIYHGLLLPVGISFYTFQTLSYTIDLYRGNIQREKSFLKFAVFVSFFPQLVAGPIVRARDFLPQLHAKTRLSQENVQRGLWLIFLGLFKKIVIADLLAYLIVDEVFENPSSFSSLDLLISLYAYAFQIYCDFSGYTDIAIGVALLMGFQLPVNFNRPYLSQTPSEFWRRWHISLSSWLRDYLYISLGGNRGSKIFTARNLLITMLLGGLWHGAAWNFVIWGAFHGFILIVFRNVSEEKVFGWKMVSKISIMFHLILFSWLLFRVPDMEIFSAYLHGLFEFSGGTKLSLLGFVVLLIVAICHFTPRTILHVGVYGFFHKQNELVRASIYAGLLMLYLGLSVNAQAFIYFQF